MKRIRRYARGAEGHARVAFYRRYGRDMYAPTIRSNPQIVPPTDADLLFMTFLADTIRRDYDVLWGSRMTPTAGIPRILPRDE